MNKNSYLFIHSMVDLLTNGCTARESLELLTHEKSGPQIRLVSERILCELKKGESLASALISSSILPDRTYHPYLIQFEQTGNILSPLSFILEDMQRKKEIATKIFEALLYPSFIIFLATVYLGFLFFRGIPWMLLTGLIVDSSIVPGIQAGTASAFLFLAGSALICSLSSICIFKKAQKNYSFWASIFSLSDSGLTFEQSLEVCLCTVGIPYTKGETAFFLDSTALCPFARTSLLTAELTGDYRGAFKAISVYEKQKLANLYSVFGKIAEPVLLAIAGIVLLILALAVLVPLINQHGGIM